MKNWWIIGAVAVFGLLVFGIQQAISQGIEKIHEDGIKIGILQTINAQQNTDLLFATTQMQKRNEYDEKMWKTLPAIIKADDGTVTGAAIGERMREHAGPAPARPTVDQAGRPLAGGMGTQP